MAAGDYRRMYAKTVGSAPLRVSVSALERSDGSRRGSISIATGRPGGRVAVEVTFVGCRLSLSARLVDTSTPGPTRDRLRWRRRLAVYHLNVAGSGQLWRLWFPEGTESIDRSAVEARATQG